jgi:hypothetical protein
MQPETKIAGLIHRVNLVPFVTVQYPLKCFPFSRDTAAEQLELSGSGCNMPLLLMKIYTYKNSISGL